jgi:hypothetical protein
MPTIAVHEDDVAKSNIWVNELDIFEWRNARGLDAMYPAIAR